MYKILLVLLLVAVVGIALHASCTSRSDKFKTVGTGEFAPLISNPDSIQLLDVRTPSEFAQGHIAGATLIDVKDSTFMATAVKKLDTAKPVAVYCRSGRRSARAAGMLAEQGYKVINLDGGIIAWQEAGLPIEK
jgi:rhodanese-related sulfurtransferase